MTERTSESLPLTWEKLRIASIVLSTLAIPVVLAVVGNSFTQSQKQQELGVRYVELAIGILRAEPSAEGKALRLWAINVVDHFSQVPLPQEARSELQSRQLNSQTEQLLRQHQQRMAESVEEILRGAQPSRPASSAPK